VRLWRRSLRDRALHLAFTLRTSTSTYRSVEQCPRAPSCCPVRLLRATEGLYWWEDRSAIWTPEHSTRAITPVWPGAVSISAPTTKKHIGRVGFPAGEKAGTTNGMALPAFLAFTS